jgi:hypothetical protein
MKRIIIIIIALLLSGCMKLDKNAIIPVVIPPVKKEALPQEAASEAMPLVVRPLEVVPLEVATTKPFAFGPFFWPENSSLNSISINYFTESNEITSIYFSMGGVTSGSASLGEADWVRNNFEPSTCHSMVFDDLEESAVYKFIINNLDKENFNRGLINTIPYGNNYQFNFAIASTENEIKIDHNIRFLILLSENQLLKDDEFYSFYIKNRELLSSTIILPLFDFSIQGKTFSLSRKGLHFIRYKNVNLILVYKNLEDYSIIKKYISEKLDDKNYIVIGNINENDLNLVIKKYSSMVDNIYVYPKSGRSDNNIIQVEKYTVINVIKRSMYTLK